MSMDDRYHDIKNETEDVTIFMPSARFQTLCHDLSLIGNSVTIYCLPNEIRFVTREMEAKGTIRLFSHISRDPEKNVTFDMKFPMGLSFNLKHLSHFARAALVAPQVILRLSAEGILGKDYRNSFINSMKWFPYQKWNTRQKLWPSKRNGIQLYRQSLPSTTQYHPTSKNSSKY